MSVVVAEPAPPRLAGNDRRSFHPPAARPEGSQQTRKDLRAVLADGVAFSLMVGIGESYLPAFALALGTGEVLAGLVSTVPLMAGALLQLVSPLAVRRLGSYRRWVMLCAAVQATTFLPLLLAAIVGHISTALVFLIAAVYWGAGMATGPAWNTWMETVVPDRMRARYFAKRTRYTQASVLVGFLGGGIALQYGVALGRPLAAFACLFLAAGMCRFVSVCILASQSEPFPPDGKDRNVAPSELLNRLRHAGDGKLLLYLLSVQCAVQIASPYFTPYMIRELHFSYTTFVMLIATSFVAKTLALPALGGFAHRFGSRRLLWISGIGIMPLSAMWLVSGNPGYLIVVQLLAGTAWAGYELAMFLLFFEAIPAKERTSVLTMYNLAHAVATITGSLIGGALLHGFGHGHLGYMAVFAASSVGRVATLMFLRKLPEGGPQRVTIARRTMALRPSAGSIDTPIVSTLPLDSRMRVDGPDQAELRPHLGSRQPV